MSTAPAPSSQSQSCPQGQEGPRKACSGPASYLLLRWHRHMRDELLLPVLPAVVQAALLVRLRETATRGCAEGTARGPRGQPCNRGNSLGTRSPQQRQAQEPTPHCGRCGLLPEGKPQRGQRPQREPGPEAEAANGELCATFMCEHVIFVTPWTVALQVPLSVGFSRPEYWSGLPFPSPRDLPDPGIQLAGRFFTI